jgi:hypothetical protein
MMMIHQRACLEMAILEGGRRMRETRAFITVRGLVHIIVN